MSLHHGPLLMQRHLRGEALSEAEQNCVTDIAKVWRKRLQDLSWFMKCLNEPIAKQANSEDNCTGHFWEARFVSQPLLSEEALLSCMAYVDLNPIRASMATTPETSDHTSIKERITPQFSLRDAIKGQAMPGPFELELKPLAQFEDSTRNDKQAGIMFTLSDYLQLVDWTGRSVRDDKRGHIANQQPPILARLGVAPKDWLQTSQHFEAMFRRRFRQAA